MRPRQSRQSERGQLVEDAVIALYRRDQGLWSSDHVLDAMGKLTDDEREFAVAIYEDRAGFGALVSLIGRRFGRYWEVDRG